jgi:hypothetical protein
MKFIVTFVVTLVVLATLVVAAPAQAATISDYQAQIEALRVQTQPATFTGQPAAKDQAGLLEKLDTASAKLALGKNADAVQKLTDFHDKVTLLGAQGKINHEEALVLIKGANQAIACIQSLTAS